VDILDGFITEFTANNVWFDFVLHDGAHDYETVLHDLQKIIPYMKRDSILMVHDTLHSHCGPGMRKAVDKALDGVDVELVTLPFGFGLDIIRIMGTSLSPQIEITKNKPGSPFVTML